MNGQPVDGTAPVAAPEMWVSITELAELKRVSKQAISKRVKRLRESGLITVREDGNELKVNLVEYDRAIGATTDPAQALRNPGLDLPPPPDESGDNGDNTGDATYAGKKAVLAGYQAESARLDLEERTGRTCDKADVEARTFGVFRRMRDRALAFPATCAPRLANAADERAIRMILDEEMRKLLEALANDLDNPDPDAVETEEAVEEPADAAPVQ